MWGLELAVWTPWRITLPSTRWMLSTWGVSGEILKFFQISKKLQCTKKSSKWSPKNHQSVQKEVQTITWHHQNHEQVEKVKSNENSIIYYENWEVGTLWTSRISIQKSTNIMPAIQTCLLTLQITEYIQKWSKIVSKGRPKIHQKSLKIPWDLPGFLSMHLWPAWL